jgi:ABC-2 type transport system permease protein
LKSVGIILRREFGGYFASPLAYIFLLIFLVLTSALTFKLGQLFERGQADMYPFFQFLPWVYLILMPALSMRLWAEERSSGSIELLLTLPVTLWQAVLGKFLAAWAFVVIALVLTVPIWMTVAYLGDPDNGAVFAGYLGSLLMAGAYLAIGQCISALTRNQVIAFIVSFVACLFLVMAGYPLVIDWFTGSTEYVASWSWLGTTGHDAVVAVGNLITSVIAGASFLTRFESITKGVLDLRDLLYFGFMITFFLLASTVVLESRKSR